MGQFEIFVGVDGLFYFHLKAENGEIIAGSQGYTTKQSAKDGIASIKRVAPLAVIHDVEINSIH